MINFYAAAAIVYWCISVPVSENGDDYFSSALSIEKACENSLIDCQKNYDYCEIKFCGEGQTINDGICILD